MGKSLQKPKILNMKPYDMNLSDTTNTKTNPFEDNEDELTEGEEEWDLNGDHKLQKNEADLHWNSRLGTDVFVDNSKIDWTGLEIPEGLSKGDRFAISTTDAFLKLPYETASTYGGTSFEVISQNQVRVIDQPYHYNYRPNSSFQNLCRNFMTWVGRPDEDGVDFSIRYINPIIILE